MAWLSKLKKVYLFLNRHCGTDEVASKKILPCGDFVMMAAHPSQCITIVHRRTMSFDIDRAVSMILSPFNQTEHVFNLCKAIQVEA